MQVLMQLVKMIENLNMLNDFNIKAAKNPFSVKSIESRNNFNFNKSSSLNIERNELLIGILMIKKFFIFYIIFFLVGCSLPNLKQR